MACADCAEREAISGGRAFAAELLLWPLAWGLGLFRAVLRA
jgi:hypothetical protein